MAVPCRYKYRHCSQLRHTRDGRHRVDMGAVIQNQCQVLLNVYVTSMHNLNRDSTCHHPAAGIILPDYWYTLRGAAHLKRKH